MDDENAFAPPQSAESFQQSEQTDDAAAKRTRSRLLRRESNIKAIGLLTLFGGCLSAIGLLLALVTFNELRRHVRMDDTALLAILLVGLLLTGAYIYAGIGLRLLQPAARIVYTLLGTLTLFQQLNALLQGLYAQLLPMAFIVAFLLLLWTPPGGTVFSAHYRKEIIPATPGIRSFLPWWFWALIILALLAVGAIVASVITAR
ncbi:MAG: hypothetical protein ACOCYP_05375 [Planctomycetota bacterium]